MCKLTNQFVYFVIFPISLTLIFFHFLQNFLFSKTENDKTRNKRKRNVLECFSSLFEAVTNTQLEKKQQQQRNDHKKTIR